MRRHPGGRRALRGLERDLVKSDARLAALFQTFTLLAQNEMMPRTERLRRRPLHALPRARRRAEPRRAERRRAGEGWRAAVRAIFYGSLALASAPGGSLCYPLGLGYYRYQRTAGDRRH